MGKVTRCLILICVFLHRFPQFPATATCELSGKIDWKFENESSLPAAELEINFGVNKGVRVVTVTEVNVTVPLTTCIFAIPYVDNKSNCPPAYELTKHLRHLRRHGSTSRFGPRTGSTHLNFSNIFPGCYYAVVRNDDGQYWVKGPGFYETSGFTYVNTQLTVDKWIVKPEDTESKTEVIAEVKVPLPCLIVEASLYGAKGRVDNTTQNELGGQNKTCVSGKEKLQLCTIEKDKEIANVTCLIKNDIVIEVVEHPYGQNDEWTTVVRWKNLPRGGDSTYYMGFNSDSQPCYMDINRTILYGIRKWKLVIYEDCYKLGYLANDNRPSPVEQSYIRIWLSVESVIAVVVLGYWIYKFVNLVIQRKRRTNAACDGPQGTFSTFDEKESNQILLIYVKSSKLFSRAMCNFRLRLAQNCHCHIYDLYANCDEKRSIELGAEGWIEKLLRDGSKVVWVDTPQFRYRLNDKEKKHTTGYFLEDAIPYAVTLATNLFQNATTQYRRHFVVRVEGFEVDDGQDDPLLVVSPYARYYVPKHISLLCEHLKSSPNPLGNTTTIEV